MTIIIIANDKKYKKIQTPTILTIVIFKKKKWLILKTILFLGSISYHERYYYSIWLKWFKNSFKHNVSTLSLVEKKHLLLDEYDKKYKKKICIYLKNVYYYNFYIYRFFFNL